MSAAAGDSVLEPSSERAAEPGELCTCGRQARTVYITRRFGEVGSCEIEGSGQRPILPCPFCGAIEGHPQGAEFGKCAQYQLRPPLPEDFFERVEDFERTGMVEAPSSDIWIRRPTSNRGCDRLEIHGAAAIDGDTSDPRQGLARWVFLDIRNAETDDGGQPVGAMPGPPVLSMAGPIEDVGHLLVGLLNVYSQLTGVPIEEWLEVADLQPATVTYVPWDEARPRGGQS